MKNKGAIEIISSLTDLQVEIYVCFKIQRMTVKEISEYSATSQGYIRRVLKKISFLQNEPDIVAALNEFLYTG